MVRRKGKQHQHASVAGHGAPCCGILWTSGAGHRGPGAHIRSGLGSGVPHLPCQSLKDAADDMEEVGEGA